jgi:chemotaxis protein CheD
MAMYGEGTITVGIADCRVSSDPETTLVTHALGSCIAVAIHDPIAQVAGLLHFMLPESSIDPERARRQPFMFADSGIPELFHTAYAQGAEKKRLTVRLVGGAQVMDPNGVFNIGKRNHLACRKILWAAGVMVNAEAVGGSVSRTVRLDVKGGALWWRTGIEEPQALLTTAKGGRQ